MTDQPDPAIRLRRLRESIARKIASRPTVDAQRQTHRPRRALPVRRGRHADRSRRRDRTAGRDLMASLVYARAIRDYPDQFAIYCRHENCVGDDAGEGRLVTVVLGYGGRGAVRGHLATHADPVNTAAP